MREIYVEGLYLYTEWVGMRFVISRMNGTTVIGSFGDFLVCF